MTRPDPVARSDAFDAADPGVVIDRLIKLAGQHGRVLKWLAISLALDVGLTIATIFLAVSDHGTSHDARRAAEQAQTAIAKATSALAQEKATCAAGNESRRIQRGLWNFVLSFPPPPNESPEQRQLRLSETAKFRAYIDKAFHPRDCEHITAKRPSVGPLPASSPHTSARGHGGDGGGASPPSTVADGPPQYTPQPSSPSPGPRPQPSSSPAPSPAPSSSSPASVPKPLRTALCKVAQICLAAAADTEPRGPSRRPIVLLLAGSLIATGGLAHRAFGRPRVATATRGDPDVRSGDQPT